MLRNILVGQTDDVFVQIIRYTFVGGVAFIIDFSSLFVLTEFVSIHYLISAAIGFLLGLTTNYLLSIIWVFSRRTLKNRWHEMVIFAAIGIIGLGLNEFFIWFFTEQFKVHYLGSKIVSTILIYLWNFLARRFMLFS